MNNRRKETRKQYEFWFVVGSQFLYGPEVLEMVEVRAREMATELSRVLPYPLVYTIGPAFGKPMAESECVGCGRCVEVCPTGAIFAMEHKDELVYYAHRDGVKTAAMISADLIPELERVLHRERGSVTFGIPVTIHLIETESSEQPKKLGTYGVIKGAGSFLGVVVPQALLGLEAAGYAM